jgi:hypothetical protein
MELYLHSPNTPSWRGAQLKHRAFTEYNTECIKATAHASNIGHLHKIEKVN